MPETVGREKLRERDSCAVEDDDAPPDDGCSNGKGPDAEDMGERREPDSGETACGCCCCCGGDPAVREVGKVV